MGRRGWGGEGGAAKVGWRGAERVGGEMRKTVVDKGQRRRGTTNNLREPCHLPREN